MGRPVVYRRMEWGPGMKWVRYTFEYTPLSKEEEREFNQRVRRAVEKLKFNRPISRFSPRRLLWLFCDYVNHRAKWNPWRKPYDFALMWSENEWRIC